MDQNGARERRLDEIRREAERTGQVSGIGVRAAASPMPIASPEEGYYRQPLLKEPQWTPLVPLYFFVGGATGALGVIGSLADLVADEPELAKRARWMSLAGVGISSALLIIDLGKPERFLNMLRVFKPQSAMSMGSWVLSGFGASATLSSLADLLESQTGGGAFTSALRGLGRAGCTLFGMPLHNYTGVLIGATCVPIWNNRIKTLPREFGMSGLQSAVSLLELTGETDSTALNMIGLLAAAVESWEGLELLRSNNRELRPAKRGLSGLLVQLAGVLSGPVPIALRLASMFAQDNRRLRQLAAASGIAGSLLLRFGWMQAGSVSARDWRIPLDIDEQEH
jgi:formate-dependent nitrite reductase membrane component NrfD